MCGRYVLASELKALAKRFGVEAAEIELSSRYNVAPGQDMPVVLHKGINQVQLMRWGLIPSWAKEAKIGYGMINARAETVVEKPSFRKPIRSQRCIVPSNGFYEWQKSTTGKVPYFIHLKDSPLFGFAGLYDHWKDPTGKEVLSYTIITTKANDMLRPLHERMPVILTPEEEEAWLDAEQYPVNDVVGFLKPYPADKMEAYPVSKDVNSARIDSPDLIKRREG
jgi:putative SOS response-associated peptidase YedK